jgi:hypothetical protein
LPKVKQQTQIPLLLCVLCEQVGHQTKQEGAITNFLFWMVMGFQPKEMIDSDLGKDMEVVCPH